MTKNTLNLKNIQKNIKPVTVLWIILIGIMLSKFITYMSTERFSEIDVSHGDIQFYGRDTCPYCVKMKGVLKESPDLYSKIEYVDIETEDGSKQFKDINASGVPHFECKSTGKSTSGFQTVPQLLNSLGLS